jgi:hypothetical protein
LNYTTEQKISEIKREIAMRNKVYRRRVSAGDMSPNEAREKISIMEEILRDYESQQAPKLV